MARVMWGMWVLAMSLWAAPAMAAEQVSHGRFQHVPVLLPDLPAQRVVLWFGDAAASTGHVARLQALRDDGALVVDIDTPHLYQVLATFGLMMFFNELAIVIWGNRPYFVEIPAFMQGAVDLFGASYPVYRLVRYSNTIWKLSAVPWQVQPSEAKGDKPITTLTLSAATVGTGRTATAAAACFEASDVGRQITSG